MRKLKDKRKAAELWIKGRLSDGNLRQIFSYEEIKDLKFGKRWVEEMVKSINPVQPIKNPIQFFTSQTKLNLDMVQQVKEVREERCKL